MRLAWFSPLLPVRTGVSVDSRELLTRLGDAVDIDVFVEDGTAEDARRVNRLPDRVAIHRAHDFVWRHQRRPYTLTVYQVGNSSHHAYQWPYLFRHPGLLVLHDGHLHHSRAAALMRQRREHDYRAEFAACHPDASVDAAELAVAGFDSHLYYYWPFTRLVVQASRLTAVHTRALRDDLATASPGAAIEHVHLAHGIPLSPEEATRRQDEVRARYGLAPDTVVFGCFGGLAPDKQLPQILDAFRKVRATLPAAVLLLGGEAPPYYDLHHDIALRDLGGHVIATGYVESEDDLTSLIAASDVTLNLRWPTARELSGPWLRALAAGRCSIVSDLAHLAGLPLLNASRWTARDPHPIAVAVDVMDGADAVAGAMRRLARDRGLREQIGAAARAYWEREHAFEVMLDDYRRLIPLAASLPAPRAALPAHLLDDTSGLTASVLTPLGVPVPWSSM